MAAQIRSGRESSGFTLWAAAALIVLLFLLFLAVLSLSITREWRDTQARASESAAAASQVVATNARWIAELSRQALSRMDEALGPNIEANVDSTAELISDAIATLPGNVRAYVIAADGQILFSTDETSRSVDVTDREYFAALREGQVWYFSPLLVSRQSGSQVFVVSKRLSRNGEFAGAAVISYDTAVLKETWESLGLDDTSTVSLIRTDGQLVARYPLANGPLDLSKHVLFTQYLPRGDTGTYTSAVSPADGISRTVGYRRVPGTPYIALASVSTESAYELFWRNTAIMLAFALPTALALAAAIVWIIRLLMRDRRRRDQLADALSLNRLLIKDTHHRVKNNLQQVMSLVRMHALPTELKTDLQNRIAAMSIVHESLYRLDQFAEVDAATLIPRIVEPLREGFALPVTIDYEVEPVVIERDSATPFALIVSEVVTNALKYAFPNRKGTIRIGFSRKPSGEPVLTVVDDGVGFDPTQKSTGMGSRLIKAMVMQLGGQMNYVIDNGTRFEATFASRMVYRPGQQQMLFLERPAQADEPG